MTNLVIRDPVPNPNGYKIYYSSGPLTLINSSVKPEDVTFVPGFTPAPPVAGKPRLPTVEMLHFVVAQVSGQVPLGVGVEFKTAQFGGAAPCRGRKIPTSAIRRRLSSKPVSRPCRNRWNRSSSAVGNSMPTPNCNPRRRINSTSLARCRETGRAEGPEIADRDAGSRLVSSRSEREETDHRGEFAMKQNALRSWLLLMLLGAWLIPVDSAYAQRRVTFPPAEAPPPPPVKAPPKTQPSGEETGIIPDPGPGAAQDAGPHAAAADQPHRHVQGRVRRDAAIRPPRRHGAEVRAVEELSQRRLQPVSPTNARLADGNNYQYATKPLASPGFDPVDIPILYMAGDYDFVLKPSRGREPAQVPRRRRHDHLQRRPRPGRVLAGRGPRDAQGLSAEAAHAPAARPSDLQRPLPHQQRDDDGQRRAVPCSRRKSTRSTSARGPRPSWCPAAWARP